MVQFFLAHPVYCSLLRDLSKYDDNKINLRSDWVEKVSCFLFYTHTGRLGTCESAVCVRIESGIESGIKIRIRIFESNLFNINQY